MPVAGVGYTKMLVERKAQITGNVKIKNNAQLKNLEKFSLNIGAASQDAIRFVFEFTTEYEPSMARILLEGEVIWIDKPEIIDSVVKQWQKEKKVPKEVMESVLNSVIQKSNIQALLLSREMNLPPPIPLPKVEITDPPAGAAGAATAAPAGKPVAKKKK